MLTLRMLTYADGDCLARMQHSQLLCDNVTKSLLFDVAALAQRVANHNSTAVEFLVAAARSMPHLSADEIETR